MSGTEFAFRTKTVLRSSTASRSLPRSHVMRMPSRFAALLLLTAASVCVAADRPDSRPPAAKLPKPGTLITDKDRDEVILCAVVQHPKGKPCIDEYGER